jgi:hypothetical protein
MFAILSRSSSESGSGGKNDALRRATGPVDASQQPNRAAPERSHSRRRREAPAPAHSSRLGGCCQIEAGAWSQPAAARDRPGQLQPAQRDVNSHRLTKTIPHIGIDVIRECKKRLALLWRTTRRHTDGVAPELLIGSGSVPCLPNRNPDRISVAHRVGQGEAKHPERQSEHELAGEERWAMI